MNTYRTAVLARRVIRQLMRDRPTVALVLLGPMLVLTLGSLLFRADQAAVPLGVVNEDEGMTLPLVGEISLGQRIMDELAAGDVFALSLLERDEVDDRLRDGTVQGVVILSSDFSRRFSQERQAEIDLRLEGSNPTRSPLIQARVTEGAMKAIAGLASGGLGMLGGPGETGQSQLPVVLATSYLYAGEAFDTMDYVAPVYIAFLAFFFVFLLTCVSFLRERSQGTMERLLATPANRLEIILGYMAGLGVFALVQVAVILFFTIWVLKIHYLGSLWLLFLVVAALALDGVALGILASTFARTEFQVVQFIPLVIIPQGLMSGLIWPVAELPNYLRPFAYAMPLTYANRALRDVMLKDWGLADIWTDLLVLAGFVLVTIAIGAVTVRREVA